MRSRNIKPGFFKNEDIAECSMEARLLFIGLWCLADRDGFLEFRPKRIKIEIFPYDDIKVEKLLDELHTAQVINLFDGKGEKCDLASNPTCYVFVVNFEKHQSPHKNEKSGDIRAKVNNHVIT